MPTRGLPPERAAPVYDRIGRMQDWQRFYEGPAVSELLSHARLREAEHVFELGCGTGALAAALLTDHLPVSASYVGVDVSERMVSLARRRLARFGPRASVSRVAGRPPLPAGPGTADRVIACYVLDLLPRSLTVDLLREAARILRPAGRLCLVSLSHGTTPVSRAVSRGWRAVARVAPEAVGGCRPIDLLDVLDGWQVEHVSTVVSWTVPSQVVVATPGAP